MRALTGVAPERCEEDTGMTVTGDGEVHGEIGVLAYDAIDDRIQCHGCGRWFEKLTLL